MAHPRGYCESGVSRAVDSIGFAAALEVCERSPSGIRRWLRNRYVDDLRAGLRLADAAGVDRRTLAEPHAPLANRSTKRLQTASLKP